MTPPPPIPPQQGRERPDPHEETHPIPRALLVLVPLMVALGAAYIGQSDLDTPAAWGDGRQAQELRSGPARPAGAADGAALFAALCVACHQANGQGLPGVFPPLAGSEWVNGRDTTAAAIVLHGIAGPLSVRGATFNGAMPAFGGQLNDEQIAAVLSHVRRQWGNAAAPVRAESVAQAREAHHARTAPFAGEPELPPHD